MRLPLFLLQMAGTSGVGKSTLAGMIGQRTGAVTVDYDVIKSAALDSGAAWDLAGRIGYSASRAVAGALLEQGVSVILDSPCRFQQLVDEGVAAASSRSAIYAFIECVLADEAELRRRLELRPRLRSQRIAFDLPPPDAPNDAMLDASGVIRIPESKLPSSPWLRIDMSQPIDDCVGRALAYLEGICGVNSAPDQAPAAQATPVSWPGPT